VHDHLHPPSSSSSLGPATNMCQLSRPLHEPSVQVCASCADGLSFRDAPQRRPPLPRTTCTTTFTHPAAHHPSARLPTCVNYPALRVSRRSNFAPRVLTASRFGAPTTAEYHAYVTPEGWTSDGGPSGGVIGGDLGLANAQSHCRDTKFSYCVHADGLYVPVRFPINCST